MPLCVLNMADNFRGLPIVFTANPDFCTSYMALVECLCVLVRGAERTETRCFPLVSLHAAKPGEASTDHVV